MVSAELPYLDPIGNVPEDCGHLVSLQLGLASMGVIPLSKSCPASPAQQCPSSYCHRAQPWVGGPATSYGHRQAEHVTETRSPVGHTRICLGKHGGGGRAGRSFSGRGHGMVEKALVSAPTGLHYYPSFAIMKPWTDCSTSLSLNSLDCNMGLIMQVLKKCYFPSPLSMSLCLKQEAGPKAVSV